MATNDLIKMSTDNTVWFYEDKAGEWRWRLVAGNGQIVAVPGEGFGSMSDAKRAWDIVRRIVTDEHPPAPAWTDTP